MYTGVTHVPVSSSEASATGVLNWRKCEWDAAAVALGGVDTTTSMPDVEVRE